MKRKKNNPNQRTTHHIIPESRKNGKSVLGLCRVVRKLHEFYHRLFGNMIPEEICEYLNHTFWNDEYEITINKKPH